MVWKYSRPKRSKAKTKTKTLAHDMSRDLTSLNVIN